MQLMCDIRYKALKVLKNELLESRVKERFSYGPIS